MKRFSLALLCATGLNAEIYIYNSQTELSLAVANKLFIASHEIGKLAFAASRGDNGEIKSLNSDATPLPTMELVRKKVLTKSTHAAKTLASTPEKKHTTVVTKVKQPSKESHPTKFKL